jgi:hypothetical protein
MANVVYMLFKQTFPGQATLESTSTRDYKSQAALWGFSGPHLDVWRHLAHALHPLCITQVVITTQDDHTACSSSSSSF